MKKVELRELAEELLEAEDEKNSISPFTERGKDLEIPDSYSVQNEIIKMKKDRGQKVIGRKIALTTQEMQTDWDVEEPIYGTILDELLYPEETILDTSEFISPRVEEEIAFYMKEELKGPGVTILDVIKATYGITPCIELIDCRIKGNDKKVQDLICDDSCMGGLALADEVHPLDRNLKTVGLVVEINGQLKATAAGAEVMGSPVRSVTWLANKLGEHGKSLKPGSIVMSGSFISPLEVKKGDSVTATFDCLGSVSVSFE